MKMLTNAILVFVFVISLFASTIHAQECVYQSRTAATNSVQISERGDITRDVTSVGNGNRKCTVNFSVRVNQDWHMASGEWEWSGNRPHQQACAKAVQLAEKAAIERIADRNVTNEQVLICNDDEQYEQLKNITVGTVGSVNQFRPHPEYDREFYHGGATCRWFVDAAFTGTDIQKYEGVICETRPNKWVVIDQF